MLKGFWFNRQINVTWRQATLTVLAVYFFGVFYALIAEIFLPSRYNETILLSTPFGLFLFGFAWFVFYKKNWDFIPNLTVLATTLMVSFFLPESYTSREASFAIFLPSVLALLVVSPLWLVIYSFLGVFILLLRADFRGLYTEPITLILYGMVISGLLASRAMAETSLRQLKRSQKEVEESDKRFSTAFDIGPFPQVISNLASGKILNANQAYCSLLGYELSEIIGKTSIELGAWVNPDLRGQIIERIASGQKASNIELEFRTRTGDIRTLLVSYERVEIHNEQCLISSSIDVTDRRKFEEQLRVREDRFRNLIANTGDMILVIDQHACITFATPSSINMMGFSPEELLGRDFRDQIHPDDLATVNQFFLHRRETPGIAPSSLIVRIIHRDGGIRVLDVLGTNRLADPTINGIILNVRDITEQSAINAALRESEDRFRDAIQNAPYPIMLHAEDGEVIAVNQVWTDLTGYTSSEILTISSWTEKAYHERSLQIQQEIFNLFSATQRIDVGEDEIFTANGERRTWDFSSAPLGKLPDGRRVLISIAVDITERKRSEALIASEKRALEMIAKGIALPETLSAIALNIEAQTSGLLCSILLLDEDGIHMRHGSAPSMPSDYIQAIDGFAIGPASGSCGTAAYRKAPVFVTDIATDPLWVDFRDLAMQNRLESCWSIPIMDATGRVLGTFAMYYNSPRSPQPIELLLIDRYVNIAAIAIERNLANRELSSLNTELEKRVELRTEELMQANRQLETALRIKDEFLATMSHELRTPLNGILGFSEMLLSSQFGSLTERQTKYVSSIDSSGRHLLGLINDLLDLAKIEAGMMDITFENTNIEELCQSSLLFVKQVAFQKDIHLSFEQDMDYHYVVGDQRRLKQILVNLLSNAVKFTPEHGSVTLRVTADPIKDSVDFSVEDTGIGISPEDQLRLFKPFTQVDSSLARHYEGTGLGLSLVQKLTELHGGGVFVQSEVGKGSIFTVRIPGRNMIHSEEKTEPSILIEPVALQGQRRVYGRKILLAEDIESNIFLLGDYLEHQGYELIYARHGQEALDKAQETNPDLILMDVQMPVMDGLTATRRLRTDSRFASVPIIALTALAMTGDRERCLEAGATEYVSKPVKLKQLAELIEELLETR